MASLTPLQGPLGHRRAAHLLRRASYRYTKANVDAMAGQTAGQAVAGLLVYFPLQLEQPVAAATDQPTPPYAWINPLPGTTEPPNFFDDPLLRQFVLAWWVNEALHDPGMASRMTMFFHQYLAVSFGTLGSRHFYDYLALLRWGALGNFKKLAMKMVTDNVMLRYLNNNENSAANPNENFAREFLELFTIGKGPQLGPGDYTHYTEDDIVQAARVLTGFRTQGDRTQIDPETGIPRGRIAVGQHDTGPKTFSDKFQGTVVAGSNTQAGIWLELQAFVDMIFAQEETARHICRRLYRYLVHRDITAEIETDVIEPLAVVFRNGGYEIKPVLEMLLQSQHFYDADDSDNADEIVGGMIKSPLELALPSLSFFSVPIPDPITQNGAHYRVFYFQAVIQRMFGAANLPLFAPSDVAGYPGFYQEPDFSRQWFNSSSIIARYKLPAMLLTGTRQIGGGPNVSIGTRLNIAPWMRDSGTVSDPADPYVLVQDLLQYLFPETTAPDRFNYFFLDVFLDNLPAADWTYEWQNYLNTDDDSEVRIPLERLINAIMYAPEYQTF
jgi:uncharacterized protein (DUF1800 family)